jgi:hypothetical protein
MVAMIKSCWRWHSECARSGNKKLLVLSNFFFQYRMDFTETACACAVLLRIRKDRSKKRHLVHLVVSERLLIGQFYKLYEDYCYVLLHSVSLCCSVYCLCVHLHWTTATGISGHFSATLPEGFSCFFLSCKANSRV